MWNPFKEDSNSKNVKQWKREHNQLKEIAGKILAAYDKKDFDETRKYLDKLKMVALKHLMDEDLTFYDMKRNVKDKDKEKEVLDSVNEFESSFRDVKLILIKFLSHYTNPKVNLDPKFKETFDTIVGVLVARIEFEESNLYTLLVVTPSSK